MVKDLFSDNNGDLFINRILYSLCLKPCKCDSAIIESIANKKKEKEKKKQF